MIGISPDYLKKIENGDRTLPPQVAQRIYLATGANASSLSRGRLRWRDGKPYAEPHYNEWCGLQRGTGSESSLAFREKIAKSRLARPFEFTLRAGIQSGRWMFVVLALESALAEIQSAFNLTARVKGMMQRD
jgi:hypothetical protein